ncbi:AIPR family protein [Paenibacillus sp. P22]|uniref:AIPR family protein n=1 Tax=Paenibacillus sp. P22 TaxID=483908 RepID=UPI0003FF9CAD|nr:AIPR family protein [Paenibacillus sp. P22]
MITLKEFHQDFLQSILSDSESRGLLKSQSFFENVCEELVSSGDLSVNYTAAEYNKTGIEIHGYDFDEERGILSLLVHQFFQEDEMNTLTMSQIKTKISRIKGFFEFCVSGKYRFMEETSDAFSMSYNINKHFESKEIKKMRIVIITDGKATKNLSSIPDEIIDNITTEFRIIDIEYIYKLFLASNFNTNFEVEVDLPCLTIPTNTEEYRSYLTFITGDVLVEIYEKFGQKLFEQNVRTFLQFKGGVNRGIKNTIEHTPEMFFAYNNGITATASSVEIRENRIKKLSNFQVVNGGQTTSAIYAAKKTSKFDVSDVSVQMKLSVVESNEKQDEYVSKISEYANTQNKVNKSDFFSNSPFHKEMKNYSRRVWAPTSGGSQRRTHWFYERVRGEYLNEQAYLTNSEKNKYQLENPKSQMLDKTFLSKSENAWLQRPDTVSKGAQYSFVAFADHITWWLEKDVLAITETYFRDAVARVILFKTVEKLISNAEWYDNGFRAQTVAYTISYLSYIVEKSGHHFNFNRIWEEQSTSKQLDEILNVIAKAVYIVITNPPPGSANAGQWCKKAGCWDAVKRMPLNIAIYSDLLIDNEEKVVIKREDKKEKRIDNGIEMQGFVVNLPMEVWRKLLSYYNINFKSMGISFTQLDILKKMADGALYPPSEKQAKVLFNLYDKALKEGAIA